jgi:hypothetical protein
MNYDWLGFFERPISAVLILAGMATIAAGVFRALKKDFSQT